MLCTALKIVGTRSISREDEKLSAPRQDSRHRGDFPRRAAVEPGDDSRAMLVLFWQDANARR